MKVREYLRKLGANESQARVHGFRTEFSFSDEDYKHSVVFMGSSYDDIEDEIFDVYFCGCDYDWENKYAMIDSRMKVSTIEEVDFILKHINNEYETSNI